jgi:hypothetical protein
MGLPRAPCGLFVPLVKHAEMATLILRDPAERLQPHEGKEHVRDIRGELDRLVGRLDHLDHAIARKVHEARDALFDAWALLRAAEAEASQA